MTESTPIESTEQPSDLTVKQVIQYLSDHPTLIAEHTELLNVLEVPHLTGGASLIEHQVQVLQEKNRQLRQQMDEHYQIASDNEKLLKRIHALYLELLERDGLDPLVCHLIERLQNDFKCTQVQVFSEQADSDYLTPLGVEGLELFADLFERDEPICGRLRNDRLSWLFGEDADAVQSVAITAFGQAGHPGLLVLASDDERQFYPGMGTLFLQLLGELVNHRIRTLGGRGSTSSDHDKDCDQVDAVNQ